MSISNMFNQKDKQEKRVFLACSSELFDGFNDNINNIIEFQQIRKSDVNNFDSVVELVFKGDIITHIIDFHDGDIFELKVEDGEYGLKLSNANPLKSYLLLEDISGVHKLGGKLPSDFKLPTSDERLMFQYIGLISSLDEEFSWLTNDFHLIYPIYQTLGYLFLDYSDSLSPRIFGDNYEMESIFPESLKIKNLEYEEIRLNLTSKPKNYKNSGEQITIYGRTGVAEFNPYFDFPLCPKTGKRMKFLCQIYGGVKVKIAEIEGVEGYEKYFRGLEFGDMADLFVFFEPDSKIACYFCQYY